MFFLCSTGRGDIDVVGMEAYGLEDAYPIKFDISYLNLANEWEYAVVNVCSFCY